jgi:hypothetical protein
MHLYHQPPTYTAQTLPNPTMCSSYHQLQARPALAPSPPPSPPPAHVCCVHVDHLVIEPPKSNDNDLLNTKPISRQKARVLKNREKLDQLFATAWQPRPRSSSIVSSVAEDTTYTIPLSESIAASSATNSVLAPSRSPSPVRVMSMPPLSRSPTPFAGSAADDYEYDPPPMAASERTEALSPVPTGSDVSGPRSTPPASPVSTIPIVVSSVIRAPSSMKSWETSRASYVTSPLTSKTEFDGEFPCEKAIPSPTGPARHPIFSFSSGLTYFMVS